MTDLQQTQLSMLNRLTQILDDNGINYWLAYGSVLGAVRHNGFIPWDDDVDVYVDGKDYFRLQDVFSSGPIDNLCLHDYKLCEGYPFTFPKVVDIRSGLKEERFIHTKYTGGIYIDIFPLYSVSRNGLLRRCGYMSRYIDYAIIEANNSNIQKVGSKLIRLAIKVLKILNASNAQIRLYRRYSKGIVPNSVFVSEPLLFSDRLLHYQAHFDGFSVLKFEDLDVKVPKLYEEYLVSQYGDYNQLPPADERHPSHTFIEIKYPEAEQKTENK